MSTILTAIIGLATTIISGWASWFLTRKKYNSEVDKTLITNMQQALEFYQKLSDDNKRRLDDALAKSQQMEKEIAELRIQLTSLATSICYDLTCKLRQYNPIIKEEDEKDRTIE